MDEKPMSQPPAVVMDVNLQALKVIRSLGRDGIRVVGIVPEKRRWEHSSRFCEIQECGLAADEEDSLLDFYVQLAKDAGTAPVLIPMQDDNVLFVARHCDELQKHYRFLLPAADIAHALVSKSGTRRLAAAFGMPQPQTFTVDSQQDAESLVGKITYPALIKPVFSRSWQTPEAQKCVRGKVVVVENDAQLVESYRKLFEIDNRLVVQEMIPGPDRNLVYFIGYFDENSDPIATFVGVKERVIPVHFGSASFVVSRYDQRVIGQSIRFMKQIGYKGHVGIEYKYDDRDDTYKLIEVNVRFGLWDGLPAICGIDFARINYDYALGNSVSCSQTFDDGIKWISFERDFRAFLKYRREKLLGFWDWVGSISTGRRDFAVFALDDPVPFILSLAPFVRDQVWRRMLSRMKSVARLNR